MSAKAIHEYEADLRELRESIRPLIVRVTKLAEEKALLTAEVARLTKLLDSMSQTYQGRRFFAND